MFAQHDNKNSAINSADITRELYVHALLKCTVLIADLYQGIFQ